MKKQHIKYIFAIILILLVFAGYFKIRKNENRSTTTTFSAIPLNASFIIEIEKPTKNIQKIFSNSPVKYLKNNNDVKNFYLELQKIDSLIDNNDTVAKIFEKKILLSAHQADNKSEFLLVSKPKKQAYIKNFIKYLSDNADSIKKEEYSNATIFNIFTNNKNFYFSFYKNIAFFSKSLDLTKASIRQIQSNNPISLNIGFKEISERNKSAIRIFINYYNIKWFLSEFANNKSRKRIQKAGNFALWSALKANMDTNFISFSGFTSVSDEFDNYLSVFLNIKPKKFDKEELIPEKTAEFMSLNLSDFPKFNSNYQKYISSKNAISSYKENSEQFYNKYKIKVIPTFVPLIDNNVIFVKCNFNKITNHISDFILIQTSDISQFSNKLNKITDTVQTIEIDQDKKINVWKLKTSVFLKILFGGIANFSDLTYFTTYNDYFIFGQSSEDIKQYLQQIYLKKTLALNPDYQKFRKKLQDKSNFYIFINNFYNYKQELNLLNSNKTKFFTQNKFSQKWQFIALQFTYAGNNIFNSFINFYYNNNPVYNGLTLWETELKHNIKSKPLIFKKQIGSPKNIFVIDDSNEVYLINKEGKIIWNKKITEPLVGSPFAANLDRNKNYQIILSSSMHIITLDANGNYLAEKSTQLPGKTEIGISVFDYDNNKKYRIFVPVQKQVYVYDNNMKPVEGWKFQGSMTKIISPVKHFSYKGKDYITFMSKEKLFILNRRGEDRVVPQRNIAFGKNPDVFLQTSINGKNAYFITSDASGNVYFISLTGKTASKKIASVSANHYFTATDINGDGILELIFTDKDYLLVYSQNGEPIFAHNFDGEVLKPVILYFSKDNIKIAVTDKVKKEIYIFNSDGSIYQNFPVKGDTKISVTELINNKFNMIVGYNNYLFNYTLF